MGHAMAREPYMMNTDTKSIPVNLWIMLWRIKAVPCILTKEDVYKRQDECSYFQHSDTMRKLRIQEIDYIECNKNYLYINGRHDCWKDRATIKYAHDALSSYGCLLINRGIIINPTYIQSIHGNEIIMQNQRILYISRARKQEVYQKCKMRIANVLH